MTPIITGFNASLWLAGFFIGVTMIVASIFFAWKIAEDKLKNYRISRGK